MQKGGEGVQIACQIAYVLNGRPLRGVVANFVNMVCLFDIGGSTSAE